MRIIRDIETLNRQLDELCGEQPKDSPRRAEINNIKGIIQDQLRKVTEDQLNVEDWDVIVKTLKDSRDRYDKLLADPNYSGKSGKILSGQLTKKR